MRRLGSPPLVGTSLGAAFKTGISEIVSMNDILQRKEVNEWAERLVPTDSSLKIWIDFSARLASTTEYAVQNNQISNRFSSVINLANNAANIPSLTQSVAADRPTVGTDLNKTVATFSSDWVDILVPLGFASIAQITIVAVIKPTSSLTTVLRIATGTANTGRATLDAGNVIRMGGRRLDADAFQSLSGTTTTTDTWVVAAGSIDYQNRTVRVYVNGIEDATPLTTFQTAGVTSATNPTFIRLGTGTTEYFPGSMAEILVYLKLLSTDEMSAITRYLRAKWGI